VVEVGDGAFVERVGLGDEVVGQRAFWDGMVRLFREDTPDNLDQLSRDIAREIEAAWLEVERSD
jgi:hypothetical protein